MAVSLEAGRRELQRIETRIDAIWDSQPSTAQQWFELQRKVVEAGYIAVSLFESSELSVNDIPWHAPEGGPDLEWVKSEVSSILRTAREAAIPAGRYRTLPDLGAALFIDHLIEFWLVYSYPDRVRIEAPIKWHFSTTEHTYDNELLGRGSYWSKMLPTAFQTFLTIEIDKQSFSAARMVADLYVSALRTLVEWLGEEHARRAAIGGSASKKRRKPAPQPDGWTKKTLVMQARTVRPKFAPRTFTRIRVAAELKPPSRGGVGQQHTYSRRDLRKLITALEEGTFHDNEAIASAWRELLDD